MAMALLPGSTVTVGAHYPNAVDALEACIIQAACQWQVVPHKAGKFCKLVASLKQVAVTPIRSSAALEAAWQLGALRA
jgi:hypothetical protein